MSTTPLVQQHCQVYHNNQKPLCRADCEALSGQLNQGWTLSANNQHIERTFTFKNYYQTIAFVNAVAWIANREDHHPDIKVSYRHCQVCYSTHSLGGLSPNDFICAAKIDALIV